MLGMKHQKFFPASNRGKPFLEQLFSAKAVEKGALVRRSVISVEKECGREALIEEVKRRRFHMMECGGQFLIICNTGRLQTYC